MECKFVSIDGENFLVFKNEDCAAIAARNIKYIRFVCFGGYMNALQIE